LTNAKPSAIYRLRPHLPSDITSGSGSGPGNLGIEIAPQAQLEGLLATLNQAQAGPEAKGKGKEVAEKVDVGKVAEKVVKNVSPCSASENGRGSLGNKGWVRSRARHRGIWIFE
jgi:hypothetical protein